MTIAIALLTGMLIGVGVCMTIDRRRSVKLRAAKTGERRILFPFLGTAVTQRALEAALRLAEAENATLVPAYLASVPMHLSLDAALPKQSLVATELLEAIDQAASRRGVPVETRIERGRTVRHALSELAEHEDYFRVVVAAETREHDGLAPEDVAWAIRYMPGEIIALRPADPPLADTATHLTRAGRFRNTLTSRVRVAPAATAAIQR